MWHAISEAETGGEKNKFIRTKVRPAKGSTAFGPVQLTGNTAKDYYNRGLLSPESRTFYEQKMAPMYSNFAKFGAEPNKPGYDPKYEYGGTGGFDPADLPGYEGVTTDIMSDMWRRANGDPDTFIRLWRGEEDPKYKQKVLNSFNAYE